MEENFKKYNKLFEDTCLIHLNRIDNHIQRNLHDGGYSTRKVKSNGLWCCSLLPIILVIYSFMYKVSSTYKIVSCISVGLLSYSILFLMFLAVSCLILRENMYAGCLAAGIISALLMIFVIGEGVVTSLILSLSTSLLYNWMLRYSIVKFPKTFSIGEAMLVMQGITLFTAMSVLMIINKETMSEEVKLINTCIYAVYATVGLMVTILYFLKDEQRTFQNLLLTFAVGIVFCLECLHMVLGLYFIRETYDYLFNNVIRRQILAFWVFLVVVAIFVMFIRTRMKTKASTVTRKTFHILASFVFGSGIFYDIELMRFAAGVGLGVLILTEALRKCNIEPISSTLQAAFEVYSDEKDSGTFAMTPIYLFVGLSCPLLLAPAGAGGARLDSLAGVLAIGVGDTAASWFGSKYGNIKWPGQRRTLEGTVFNIMSQVGTVYTLQLFQLLNDRFAITRALVAATVTALVEAKTEQVDNLILPFVSLIAFQLTWILS